MGAFNELSYKKIRKEYQPKYGLDSIAIDAYAYMVSPLITKICLKLKLLPNTITIGMIISGIVGAVFFSINSLICKSIGIVFIHLWYILDCSDGEVARITSTFSDYGKEIDYMAHTVNHPLFIISFFLAFYKSGEIGIKWILIWMLIMCSDGFFRMIFSLDYMEKIKRSKENYGEKRENKVFTFRRIGKYIMGFFTQFPNFALIFPILFIINIKISAFYIIVDAIASIIIYIHALISWIHKVHYK